MQVAARRVRAPHLPSIPTGRVTVTPAMARDLRQRHHDNRPVSRREVDRLKRVLETGKWEYNGEAVKFDTKGHLRDGQHRLTAIEESGVPAELLIVSDLPLSAFRTLDQGRKRTGGDVLSMRGIKRYNAAAVASATLYRILKNRAIYGAVDPIPAYGIDEVVDRHPGLIASLEYCAPFHGQGDAGVIGLGYLTAFHYIIETLFEKPEKAAAFVEGVTLGSGLKTDSPVLQFRRRVMSGSRGRDVMHAQAKTALMAKMLGLYMSNQHVTRFLDPPTSATYETLIPGLAKVVEDMNDRMALRDLAY